MGKPPAAILWNGFYYRWNRWPHRLSILGSRIAVDHNHYQPDVELDASHEFHLKIGNWPKEAARYRIPYTIVTTDQFFIGKGQTETFDLVSKIEKGVELEKVVTINPDNLHFQNLSTSLNKFYEQPAKVLINGFKLWSVNNTSGWHFGGLGIQITRPEWTEDGNLQFRLRMYTRPARSPELVHQGNHGWNPKQDCVYRLQIDYAVITGDEATVQFNHFSLSRKDESPNWRYSDYFHTEINGQANSYDQAFLGMAGFYMNINPPHNALFKNRSGRYMRVLGLYTKDLDYDPIDGIGRFNVGMVFSNKGDMTSLGRITSSRWTFQSRIDTCMIQATANTNIKTGVIAGETGLHETCYREKLGGDDQ